MRRARPSVPNANRRPGRLVGIALALALALGASPPAAAASPDEPAAAPASPAAGVDAVATPDPVATPDGGGPPAPPDPEPEPEPPAGEGSLATGLTEPNPNLIWPPGSADVPATFAPWRDAVAALRPHYYRLQLDWAQLQPTPDGPTELDRPQAGCMRDVLPCAPWMGVREQLSALAAQQREGGWETVVAISGTPAWAAESPHGCERDSTLPRSRAPRSDALAAYKRMVTDVLNAADDAGARLRWWNAWNEPNHPYFLSPQRAECDVTAPSEATGVYVRLHAALGEALDVAPGEQDRILGDLAGTAGPGPHLTSVREFIAGLPQETVCGTRIWAQHAYLAPRDDAVVAREALAARGCPSPHEIWVTETGARNNPLHDPPPLRRCQSLNRRLRSWYADPAITVAFQYTAREDDIFPYGLFTAGLGAAYPVLDLWRAWGGAERPSPADPPPSVRAACPDPTEPAEPPPPPGPPGPPPPPPPPAPG